MKHKILLFLAAGCLLMSAGCSAAKPISGGSHPPVTLSAWAVSWDKSGLAEYKKTEKLWDSISTFAAGYDEKGNLLLPADLPAKEDFKGKPFYLTIVNDRISEGNLKEKDPSILTEILKTEESRRKEARRIIALAERVGAGGIDIDFERFGKDEELIGKFCDFTRLLSLEALPAHKKVRIILEPSMPMDAPYSTGAEYVVMMYNLYGTHSGPGPKADGDFIEKTLKKMENLPGKKAAAFSTGGCMWKDAALGGLIKGKGKFITQKEAEDLLKAHKVKTERNPESAALHFEYKEKGAHYDVWYADHETLNAWITLAARAGIPSVHIWRLGGNPDLKDISKGKGEA